jgi:hypothetical protein
VRVRVFSGLWALRTVWDESPHGRVSGTLLALQPGLTVPVTIAWRPTNHGIDVSLARQSLPAHGYRSHERGWDPLEFQRRISARERQKGERRSSLPAENAGYDSNKKLHSLICTWLLVRNQTVPILTEEARYTGTSRSIPIAVSYWQMPFWHSGSRKFPDQIAAWLLVFYFAVQGAWPFSHRYAHTLQ